MGRAWIWLALALLSSAGGCGGEGKAPDQTRAEPAAPQAPAEPWRFRPTLEQHLPARAVAEPVLELSLPREHVAIVLAAVLRDGAPDVGIERWTFEQTPEQTLRLLEGGERLVRLADGPRHRGLGELRRKLATPRAVLTRPLGLGNAPKTTIERLVTAFSTLRDRGAEPRARVRAAATVIRGLDDSVVLERDAAGALGDLLTPGPRATEIETLSERRARATVTLDDGTASLELLRKADGWAITAFEPPTPSEPPPAPSGSTGPAVDR